MNNYSTEQIKEIVSSNKKVRLVFTKDRAPLYGKLVMIADGEDLLSKGFVRFVLSERLDWFEGAHPEQMYGAKSNMIGSVMFTKIYAISDFLNIVS